MKSYEKKEKEKMPSQSTTYNKCSVRGEDDDVVTRNEIALLFCFKKEIPQKFFFKASWTWLSLYSLSNFRTLSLSLSSLFLSLSLWRRRRRRRAILNVSSIKNEERSGNDERVQIFLLFFLLLRWKVRLFLVSFWKVT